MPQNPTVTPVTGFENYESNNEVSNAITQEVKGTLHAPIDLFAKPDPAKPEEKVIAAFGPMTLAAYRMGHSVVSHLAQAKAT